MGPCCRGPGLSETFPFMTGIEVIRDGRVWRLADREAAIRMARIGLVGPADNVREGDQSWQEARQLDWLASSFLGDPWDAWEELEGKDPEGIWAATATLVDSEEDLPEVTDLTQIQDLGEGADPPVQGVSHEVEFAYLGTQRKTPRSLPDPGTSPVPEAPPSSPRAEKAEHRFSKRAEKADTPETAVFAGEVGSDGPPSLVPVMGQVIAFPQGRGGAAAAPLALHSQEPSDLLEPLAVHALGGDESGDGLALRDSPPAEPRAWAPWLLVMALILCIAAFGLSIWSVHLNARWTSPRTLPAPVVVEVADVEPEPLAEPQPEQILVPQEAEDERPLVDLEALAAELRERIPVETLALQGGPDDLASALLIELSNMKLGPVRVSAPVVSWTGARNDVVEVADIEVRLTATGNIERDLAAVGLVVGKYLQQYGFRVRDLSIIVVGNDGVSRKRQLDPGAARSLWTGRKSLYDFLTGD